MQALMEPKILEEGASANRRHDADGCPNGEKPALGIQRSQQPGLKDDHYKRGNLGRGLKFTNLCLRKIGDMGAIVNLLPVCESATYTYLWWLKKMKR